MNEREPDRSRGTVDPGFRGKAEREGRVPRRRWRGRGEPWVAAEEVEAGKQVGARNPAPQRLPGGRRARIPPRFGLRAAEGRGEAAVNATAGT